MSSSDDFYVVLSSNDSPLTHPANSANDFTVSWDDPIDLRNDDDDEQGRWKVALTEMSYNYKPHSLCTIFAIKYQKHEQSKYSWTAQVWLSKKNGVVRMSPLTFRAHNCVLHANVNKENFKIFLWSNAKFSVTATNSHDLSVTQNSEERNKKFYIDDLVSVNDLFTNSNALQKATLKLNISCEHYETKEYVFNFPEDVLFHSKADMAKYIQTRCNRIFHSFEYDENVFKISFAERVFYIQLLNGLHFALGFDDTELFSNNARDPHFLARDTAFYKANHGPQLLIQDTTLHVLSNICNQTRVGRHKIPLLRNIPIKVSNVDAEGHVQMLVFHPYNEIFVDVAPAIINGIRITIQNIRDRKQMFPKGSITRATLHFKWHKQAKRLQQHKRL